MDIQLVAIDPLTKMASLKVSPKTVKGLTKLIQIVVLSLLNTPGKDILDPERGGGIPEMIGMNIDPGDLSEVLSEVTRRVKKSEAEIIKDQIGLELPVDERLREIKIVNVGHGTLATEVLVRIRVVNELGQQSDVVF